MWVLTPPVSLGTSPVSPGTPAMSPGDPRVPQPGDVGALCAALGEPVAQPFLAPLDSSVCPVLAALLPL